MSFSLRRMAGTAVLAVAASALTLPLAAPAQAATVEKAFFTADVDGDGTFGLYLGTTPNPTSSPAAVTADDTANGTVDVFDLATSRDGSRVIYVQDTYTTAGDPLREKILVRDVSTQLVRVLLDLDLNGTIGVAVPQLSRDGDTAVWTQIDFVTEAVSIRKVAVASGNPTTVVNGYGGATFLNDTTLFIQAATDFSAHTIAVTGGAVGSAAGFPAQIGELAVSPDGSHVAWSRPDSPSTSTVESATLSGTTASSVLTLDSSANNAEPTFSSDGNTVYFIHNGGGDDIYSSPTAGGGATSVAPVSTTADEGDVAVSVSDGGTVPGDATTLPAVLNATTATIKWALPSDADLSGLLLTRKYAGNVQKSVFVPAPVTSYADTGLVVNATYAYELTTVDRSGNHGATVTRLLTALKPLPTSADPTSKTSTKASFPVSFAASAPSSARFVVDYLVAGTTTWKHWVTNATGRIRTFGSAATTGVNATTSVPGTSYVFRAQAKDAYGNATGFVSSARAVVPFDQSKATLYGGTSYASSSAYLGSFRKLGKTTQYAKVTLTGNRLQVIGFRCTTCGVFTIYDGRTLVGTIDTRASSTVARTVLYTRSYSSVGTHTFTIRPKATAGRPYVILDGFAMRR